MEEGLRIKEKRGQGEVVAVTLGPDRAKEALRSALAMGCDRAIHVNDPALATADTLTTARALAAVIKQEAPQLVLCGRQATTTNGAGRQGRRSGLAVSVGSWRRPSTARKTVKVGVRSRAAEVSSCRYPAVLSAQKG